MTALLLERLQHVYTRFSRYLSIRSLLQSTNAPFEVPLLWINVVLPGQLCQLALPFLFLRAVCLGQPIFKLPAEAA